MGEAMNPGDASQKTPSWARGEDPYRRQLANAAAASRALGLIFAFLGCLPLGIAFVEPRMEFRIQALAFTDTLVLVGPGVWYFVASWFIRRHQRSAVVVTRRIATAQLGLIVLMLAAMFYVSAIERFMLAPALLSLFFVPALVAFLVELVRAERVVDLILPMRTAFTPVMPASGDPKDNGAT